MLNENPFNIQINYQKIGDNFLFLITGGKAHIGATATAYLQENEIKIESYELPHHKEGALAKECAEMAIKRLGQTVSVIAGIHIDTATKEQIDYIVNYVRTTMKLTLDKINKD